MTNIGDVFDWLDAKMHTSEDTTAMDLWHFFENLPLELDLASAGHYLRKEFKRNDTGVDDRYSAEIYVAEPEVYDDYSGYDGEDEDDGDYVPDDRGDNHLPWY